MALKIDTTCEIALAIFNFIYYSYVHITFIKKYTSLSTIFV